jgi:GR25 family glycosyltransferase involved in LPS biosynthesis
MSNYNYFKDDYTGYDLCCVGRKSIPELMKICDETYNCVAFNTFGYMKYYVDTDNLKSSAYFHEGDGLFVNTTKLNELKKNIAIGSRKEYDDYVFIKCKDIKGGNMMKITYNNLDELKTKADRNPNCVGFNTFGMMKNSLAGGLEEMTEHANYNGVYIKKFLYDTKKDLVSTSENIKYRIKLICNWITSEELCNEWNHMTQNNNYIWNNIEFTWKDDAIDFYIIINKPRTYDIGTYDPSRTIVFQMEPWCGDTEQVWGVKTWGEWAIPARELFFHVQSHKVYMNNCMWQLKTSYQEFMSNPALIKKTKCNKISSICSSKYFDPGHIKRIDFLKFVESQNDPDVHIDIYNHDNDHKFKNYAGPHPPGNKDIGMIPYKYYFMSENNCEKNFITEKIFEPLLTESLCFYWGCPNIAEYFDPRCYIELDLNDFQRSFEIIKNAILNDEWSKRLDIIRREKQKVLNYYNFFPTVERIIKCQYGFNKENSKVLTNDEITYHKYFSRDIDLFVKPVKIAFIHSCNNGKVSYYEILNNIITKLKTSGLYDKLDVIYIVNIGQSISVLDSKIRIIEYSDDMSLCEKPTLNLINTLSKFLTPDSKILYLHTKGISYQPGTEIFNRINDWTNCMLHFLVENHTECMNILNTTDVVGINYHEKPHSHFSGNFWWTNASHASSLNMIISSDRHDCEWWILSNGALYHNLYSDGINHYEQLYPESAYAHIKFNNELPSDMKIKCLNLQRREDRKENMKKQFSDQGINSVNFVNATDAKTLELNKNIKKMFAGNDFGNRKTFIACALSHIELWKQLLSDNCDKYLIFEDDAKMTDNLIFKLKYIDSKKETYDMLYLGYQYFSNETQNDSSKYMQKVKPNRILLDDIDYDIYVGGYFAYIITKEGAKKMLDFISLNGVKHGIDYIPKKYKNDLNMTIKSVYPFIVTSDFTSNNNNTDSDIQRDLSTFNI